jgi:hypothetical protein
MHALAQASEEHKWQVRAKAQLMIKFTTPENMSQVVYAFTKYDNKVLARARDER